MLAWATLDGRPGSAPLPVPQPLELVWQAAKVAEGEGWPEYFERRRRVYSGGTPKRRYLDRSQAIAGACFGAEADGLVAYVPSRAFYCTAYERATSALPEFRFLQALVRDGFDLLLLGPDGHPVGDSAADIDAAYQ